MYSKAFLRHSMFAIVVSLGLAGCTNKNETALEKAETLKNEAVDAVNEGVREIDNQICETINGKVECVAKEAINDLKNVGDALKTDSIEQKNKVD